MNRYLKILLFVLAGLVCAQQGQARNGDTLFIDFSTLMEVIKDGGDAHEEDEKKNAEVKKRRIVGVLNEARDGDTLFVDFSTLMEVIKDGGDAHEEDGMKDADVKKWRIAGTLNDGLQTVLIAACLVLVIVALRKIDRIKRDTRELLRRQPETAAAITSYPYSQSPARRAPQSTVQASGTYSHPPVYQKPTAESQNSRPTPAPAKKQARAETSSFKLYAEGQVGGGTLYKVSPNPEGKVYEITLTDEHAAAGTFRVNENCGIMEAILNNYNSYLADCEIAANHLSNPSKIENTKPGKVEKNPDGTWRVVDKAQVILR